jgi:ubiquinone/menaquinone biosynthesis C-methylase UbiE
MLKTPAIISNVETWNDLFAREHDIDDYYAGSGFVIRWIEQRRLACIRRLAAAQPRQRLLEVGCGGGHALRLFPECELTGVDVSGHMLEKARRNLEGYRVRLLKGELSQHELADASFDRIVCTEVLEHAVNPDTILAGIRRLLRPDGRAVITFPNDPLVHRLKSVIRGCGLTVLPPFRRISWGGDKYHLHTWTVAQMRELLGRFFVIERTEFAPSRLLPIRCCFACTGDSPRS